MSQDPKVLIILTRLEALAHAIRARDWDQTEFQYDRVLRSVTKLQQPTREPPASVRQTSCRLCGQDIEGFAPYRRGEWRDRGNNTHCNDGRVHTPVPEEGTSEYARYRANFPLDDPRD